jgi:hypothetical protein
MNSSKSQKQRLSSRAVWLRKRNRDIQIDRRNHHLRGSNEKPKKRKGWYGETTGKKERSKQEPAEKVQPRIPAQRSQRPQMLIGIKETQSKKCGEGKSTVEEA